MADYRLLIAVVCVVLVCVYINIVGSVSIKTLTFSSPVDPVCLCQISSAKRSYQNRISSMEYHS